MNFSVGVIGATGYIGTPYREEIRQCPQATIVALCARRRDRLEAAREEDGAALISDDWRQVVEHPDVNLVLVLTPDALHYEPVLESARRGKHVFCEKPLGRDARQAGEMWSAVRQAGVAHYVPFWTRYVPVFARARQIVREGALGALKAIVYRWHNPRPLAMPFTWRDDAALSAGGSIADVGSHAYDTVRWMTGLEATRVLVHADCLTPPKPDLGPIDLQEALQWGQQHAHDDSAQQRAATAVDYAAIAWQFDGGAVGTLVLSHTPFLRKGLAPELELHGSDASLAVDRLGGTVTLTRGGEQPPAVERVADPGFGNRFAQHVFPALEQRAGGAACHHPGLDDGWRVQVFTDAAALAAQRGCWVELEEVG